MNKQQFDPKRLRLIDWPRPSLNNWPVHSDYRVVRHGKTEYIEPQGDVARTFDAETEASLARHLLDTKGATDGILSFARRFGLAGFTPNRESVLEWRSAYDHLRTVEECVFMRRKGQTPHPHDQERVFEPRKSAGRPTAEAIELVEGMRLPIASRHFAQYLRPLLGRNNKGLPVLKHQPIGLVGVMWFQMIRHYTGELDWKICPGCNQPMAIGTDLQGKRQDAEFHSPTCRAQFTNRWRSRALQLRKDNEPVSAIAQQLGIDKERIKQWLTSAERQRRKRTAKRSATVTRKGRVKNGETKPRQTRSR